MNILPLAGQALARVQSSDPFGIVEMSFHWKMGVYCGVGVSSYHLDSKNVYWKNYMSAIQVCVG